MLDGGSPPQPVREAAVEPTVLGEPLPTISKIAEDVRDTMTTASSVTVPDSVTGGRIDVIGLSAAGQVSTRAVVVARSDGGRCRKG